MTEHYGSGPGRAADPTPADEQATEQAATMEELSAKHEKLSATLQSKMNFVENMGLSMPDPIMMLKIRLEYWIALMSLVVEDGERWMVAGEIGWLESMIELMDQGIQQMPPEDRAAGIHLA